MYIYFMDIHGMILPHGVPHYKMVNKEYYSKASTDVFILRIRFYFFIIYNNFLFQYCRVDI